MSSLERLAYLSLLNKIVFILVFIFLQLQCEYLFEISPLIKASKSRALEYHNKIVELASLKKTCEKLSLLYNSVVSKKQEFHHEVEPPDSKQMLLKEIKDHFSKFVINRCEGCENVLQVSGESDYDDFIDFVQKCENANISLESMVMKKVVNKNQPLIYLHVML